MPSLTLWDCYCCWFSQVFQCIAFFLFLGGLVNLVTHKAKLFQEKLLEHLINLVSPFTHPFYSLSSQAFSKYSCFIVLQLSCKVEALQQHIPVALMALQTRISISCQIILLEGGKKCRLTAGQAAAVEESWQILVCGCPQAP